MKIKIKGQSLTLMEWHSILIDWIEWRILMPTRLMKCQYCDNTGEGCDCGACGMVHPGSHGYAWCLNYQGCPVCRRGRL